MRVALFYHSIVSCWNNGNAHFLRGVAVELLARGHQVAIHEPAGGWSRANLLAEHGPEALADAMSAFPDLVTPACSLLTYDPATLDLDAALDRVDLVIVHEWNTPELVARIGAHHARVGGYTMLFHDTHHRALTDPKAMAGLDLRGYDGVLAFGRVVRDRYLAACWTQRAWTWHEAADIRIFHPIGDDHHGVTTLADETLRSVSSPPRHLPVHGYPQAGVLCGERPLVWVGNWGDGERSLELKEFLLGPVRALRLRATVYGVRYPPTALRSLRQAGAAYAGWLPNHRVPRVFARHAVTMHVPRRPYARILPGIPTIRVFEALACGIPLVSVPWEDLDGLFSPGEDYLVARDGAEMARHLQAILADSELAESLAAHGLATIRARHTCAHRVDQLLDIVRGLQAGQ